MLKKILLTGLMILSCHTVLAKEFNPTMQSIRVIIPYAVTGGPFKVYEILERYGAKKNIKFYPEFRPGAEGTIGVGATLTYPADGNTLLLTVISDLESTLPSKKYNSSDFIPVAGLCRARIYFVANPKVTANSLTELAQQLKADPERYSWAVSSKATTEYLEYYSKAAGIETNRLLISTFNTKMPGSVASVVGGHLDLGVWPAALVNEHVKANKLKLLGTWKGDGTAVESVEETFKKKVYSDGFGVFVRTGTDPKIALFWNRFFEEFKNDSEVQQQFENQHFRYINGIDAVNQILKQHRERRSSAHNNQIDLTPRQLAVADLIGYRGLTNKQIAQELGISESAVKLHVGLVMKKYGVQHRTQIAAYMNS